MIGYFQSEGGSSLLSVMELHLVFGTLLSIQNSYVAIVKDSRILQTPRDRRARLTQFAI